MVAAFQPEHYIFRSSTFQQVLQDVLDFLISTTPQPLPPPSAFTGAGVYLVYYTGALPLYAAMAAANQSTLSLPIYAGKAVPSGWRQARETGEVSNTLYRRLKEHGSSINAAENLLAADFQCRLVILAGAESSLIAPVEAALIRHYRPLWNSVIDGFGNHDPGINRYGQMLAGWDTLHPGRSWERKWQGARPDLADLMARIATHLAC